MSNNSLDNDNGLANNNRLDNHSSIKLLYYPIELKLYIIEKIKQSSTFSTATHLDKFLYIVNIFYSRKHLTDIYADGIPINILKLRKLIADNRAERFIKALCEWNVIRKTKNHSKAYSASKYQLSDQFASIPYKRNRHYSKTSKHWFKKLIKTGYDDFGDQPLTSIEKYQLDILKKITFSDEFYKDFAIKYPYVDLRNLPDDFMPGKSDHIIFSLMDQNLYSKRRPGKEDRLYSNITNLKSGYRKYILIDGKKLIGVDIKGSQLFLGVFKIESLIKMKLGKSVTDDLMPEDFKKFKQEILFGKDIYKFIAEGLVEGYQKEISLEDFERLYIKNRKGFKKHIFEAIWYCYYQSPTSDNTSFKIFQEIFPSVADALNHFKSKGKSHFPVALQKKEADLILDRVGKQLMKKNIQFLTIHDSVLVTSNEDLLFTKTLIHDVFENEYGISPKLSEEYY